MAATLNYDFIAQFKAVAAQVYGTAKEKGWWDRPREDGTQIALIHSEISEALEAQRAGNPASDKIPDFTCEEEELADAVIRIMDRAEHKGYRLAEAILAKAEYNKAREYRHGGKAF